jgi:hypothetical protein
MSVIDLDVVYRPHYFLRKELTPSTYWCLSAGFTRILGSGSLTFKLSPLEDAKRVGGDFLSEFWPLLQRMFVLFFCLKTHNLSSTIQASLQTKQEKMISTQRIATILSLLAALLGCEAFHLMTPATARMKTKTELSAWTIIPPPVAPLRNWYNEHNPTARRVVYEEYVCYLTPELRLQVYKVVKRQMLLVTNFFVVFYLQCCLGSRVLLYSS